MSEVMQEIEALELEVREHLHSPDGMDCSRSHVHAFAMKVARVVEMDWLRRTNTGGLCPPEDPEIYRARLARERFPLPPKRELREEQDPESAVVRWRYSGDGLEYTSAGNSGWRGFALGGAFAPTNNRIDLWHSLKHEPYREVPDNGDE